MTKYGYPWPDILSCHQFPLDNDMCILAQHVMGGVEGLPKEEIPKDNRTTPFVSSESSLTTKRPFPSSVFFLPQDEDDLLVSKQHDILEGKSNNTDSSYKKKRKRKNKIKNHHHEDRSESMTPSLSRFVEETTPNHEGLHHHKHHHYRNETSKKRGRRRKKKLSTTTSSLGEELSSIIPPPTTWSSISHQHSHHHLQTMLEEKQEYDAEQLQIQNNTREQPHLYSTTGSSLSGDNLQASILTPTEDAITDSVTASGSTDFVTDSRKTHRKKKKKNRRKHSHKRPFEAEPTFSSTEPPSNLHLNPIFQENQFDVSEKLNSKSKDEDHEEHIHLDNEIAGYFCKSTWILKARGNFVKQYVIGKASEKTKKMLISFKLHNYKVLHGDFNHREFPSDILLPFNDVSETFLKKIFSSSSSVNESHFLDLIPVSQQEFPDEMKSRTEQSIEFLDSLLFTSLEADTSTPQTTTIISSNSHSFTTKKTRKKKKRRKNKTTQSPLKDDRLESKTIAEAMKRGSWIHHSSVDFSLDSSLDSLVTTAQGIRSNKEEAYSTDDDGATTPDFMIQEQGHEKSFRSKRSAKEWDSLLRVPSMNGPTYDGSPAFLLSQSMANPSEDHFHESLDSPQTRTQSSRPKYFIMGFTKEVSTTKTTRDHATGKRGALDQDSIASRGRKKKSFIHVANLVILWPTSKSESSLFR